MIEVVLVPIVIVAFTSAGTSFSVPSLSVIEITREVSFASLEERVIGISRLELITEEDYINEFQRLKQNYYSLIISSLGSEIIYPPQSSTG